MVQIDLVRRVKIIKILPRGEGKGVYMQLLEFLSMAKFYAQTWQFFFKSAHI